MMDITTHDPTYHFADKPVGGGGRGGGYLDRSQLAKGLEAKTWHIALNFYIIHR